jgi:hypothetical protein
MGSSFPSPSSDTDKEVPGAKDEPGANMNDEGQMPMPKRKKRNNNKRDD